VGNEQWLELLPEETPIYARGVHNIFWTVTGNQPRHKLKWPDYAQDKKQQNG